MLLKTITFVIINIYQVYATEKLPGNLTDFTICKVSHLGLDYVGDVGKTESRVRCQAWTSNTPHKVHASYTDDKFPEYSKEKAKNYCRNPSRDSDGPWCYTTDNDNIDETCGLKICSLSECRLTGPGIEYGGAHNYVTSGDKCLKWSKDRKKVKTNDTFVSVKKFHKKRFPDESVDAAKKRCRNPDGDIGGPWCFVELQDTNQVEKRYCDIPFCDDPDCIVFTKNDSMYSHYTALPEKMTNFTFGVKIWDPDSYIQASARLVLTLIPLPIFGKDLKDLGIGFEILLTNKQSALTFGNKDKPEYETTHGILKSTSYTFFSLTWDRGFITLNKQGMNKPVFLQELKTKNTLMSHKKDTFNFYAAQGTNILWSFPFCDDTEDCDVHTTTSDKFQQFWPLRQTEIGHELHFYVRAAHSAYIQLVASPVKETPCIEILLSRSDNFTRVFSMDYANGPKTMLKETTFTNLLNYWKFTEMSISLFSDTLHLYWSKDVGNFMILSVKHPVIKKMRWYSPSSENSIAHWSFYCPPPQIAYPPFAYLPECALSDKENNYIGSQDVTSSGLACLPWAATKMIPVDTKELFKGTALFDAYNFCRDPKNELKGTYCYAISQKSDKRITKQYCKIRKCRSADCKMAGTANDYLGKQNTTRSNRTCQYWIAQVPLKLVKKIYDVRKNWQPDESLDEAIHDPVFHGGNVTDEKIAAALKGSHKITIDNHEYSLNDTAKKCKKPKRSAPHTSKTEAPHKGKTKASHSGKTEAPHLNKPTVPRLNQTELGSRIKNVSQSIISFVNETAEAIGHVKVHNVELRYLNGTLYADMSPQVAKNYCRNPSRTLAGAWCYTMDPDVSKDSCYVPDCDRSEECTVFIKGDGHGREVYVLPQWKETGIHGGLRFSVKQWNPDIQEGIQIEIYSLKRHPKFKLIMGDENNDRLKFLNGSHVLKEKTLPHLIPAGRWNSFWLQLRRGELMLGFEGVPSTLFEWKEDETAAEHQFDPVYMNFKTLTGNLIGLFFKCDDCHTETTTTHDASKIMPINIWMRDGQISFNNLTLHVRGKGTQHIKLMILPGTGEDYVISFEKDGTKIKLVKNMKHLSRVSKEVTLKQPALFTNSWSLMNISFTEKDLNITVNETIIFSYTSEVPLLFYYFAVTAENGWMTWIANCDYLDIDGPPLDGGWSEWSAWECTVTCGGGEGFRTRTCSNPRPNIFGRLCEGSPTSTGRCNDFVCGDISDETIEAIRVDLQTTNSSFIVDEGKSVSLLNNREILTQIETESPDAYYEWSLNGQFIEPDNRINFIGDDLIVKNISIHDTGVYICMLYRVNKKRLVLHVATVAVKTKHFQISTRATLPLTIESHALSLGYVYSDLRQKWMVNKTIFIDYGITSLAAVSYETFEHINRSFNGDWKCVIEQSDLNLAWTTNLIRIQVKKKPNIYTHLMEDAVTKPIFGRLKTDSAVAAVLLTIVISIFLCVAFALFAYLKWCRLPNPYKNRKKNKKRNRRFK